MFSLSSKDLLTSFNSILRTGLRYCHMIWNNLPTPVQISKLFDMPNNTYQLSLKATLSCEIFMRMLIIQSFCTQSTCTQTQTIHTQFLSISNLMVFVLGQKKNLICIGTKQLIKLTGHEWSQLGMNQLSTKGVVTKCHD